MIGVASVFEDVFGGNEELPSLLVQVKSEEWGGEFVDLKSDATIPDRSVLRVVVGKCKVSLKPTYSKVTRELFVHGEVLTNNLLKYVWQATRCREIGPWKPFSPIIRGEV